MRVTATCILLALSVFVGEIHTFWEGGEIRTQDWIWKVDRPMALQWNIKYLSDEISWLLAAIALACYKKNIINQVAAASFVFFQVASIFLYFYNFKTYGYGLVYGGVVLFGIIYYLWKFYK